MRIAPSSGGASAAVRPVRPANSRQPRSRGASIVGGLLGAAHRDPRPLLLDRDLGDARLLDDPYDLADPLGPRLVDLTAEQRLLAARALANRAQERLGLFPEQREQQELLLARREPFRLVANVVQFDRLVLGLRLSCDQGNGSPDRFVDLPGRRAESSLEQVAELVDDGLVAGGGENVDDRLRAEDLADRSGHRRRAGFASDDRELFEHVVEPVGRAVRSQASVDGRDEPGRQLVLRSANGDSRRERRHRIVTDELVHDLRRAPQRLDVDAAGHPCARERAREGFPRHSVEGQRDRVDGARDEVCSNARGLERCCETTPRRALAIETHGETAAFGERGDQLACPMRLERARRVVQEHASRSEVGQLLRLLDEWLRLSASPRAVDEARVELALGGHDRLARLTKVLDVVQRILEPEDVDPALGRARNEASREVTAHRTGADEKSSTKRHAERRLRPRLERADPLPRALDAAAHGRVEDPTARDLEVREAGAVEQLGQAEQVGGRHPPGQRLLAEQANSRVHESRHEQEGNALQRIERPRQLPPELGFARREANHGEGDRRNRKRPTRRLLKRENPPPRAQGGGTRGNQAFTREASAATRARCSGLRAGRP